MAAELVADCPRCGATQITFDLLAHHPTVIKYGWQRWYEAFSVCRHCQRATTFVLSESVGRNYEHVRKVGLQNAQGSLNNYMNVERYISVRDVVRTGPPEHVPERVKEIFNEGATCLSVKCFNAAGTMFRLCVDLATRSLLPDGEVPGLNKKVRRDLGLRLPWLFDANLLPRELKDLSSCIKEDGNDGAHAGTLKEQDAEDLLDFTTMLLERLYTEPERLKLAQVRRDERRAEPK